MRQSARVAGGRQSSSQYPVPGEREAGAMQAGRHFPPGVVSSRQQAGPV